VIIENNERVAKEIIYNMKYRKYMKKEYGATYLKIRNYIVLF